MSLLRLNITMSVDGYVAGPNQSVENPLGEGGNRLHEWAFATRSMRVMHGMEGGETGPDDEVFKAMFLNLGATIMGRNMFGPVRGPWGDEAWRGWWGENPPYHTDVFVLTHYPRNSITMEGGTTFHFVTEGIHAALERAKIAAGDRDVSIAGGANAVQQYMKEGLIDEIDLHVAPILLGSGERLFENTDGQQSRYECVRVVHSPLATHYKYRR
jgi:dihydrofolate reductase